MDMDLQGDAEDVELAGGLAKYVPAFKYLGGIVSPCGTCDRELAARIGKAMGKFRDMKQVWCSRRVNCCGPE